jgi:hypothetical protein
MAVSSEDGYQYRAVFSNAVGSVTSNPVTLTVVPDPGPIWSGYVVSGATFSAVTGSWVVPAVTCALGANTDAMQWVGIDGYVSPTVEQDGTATDCVAGTPQYYAWYAIYGDASVNGGLSVYLSLSAYPVDPGDAVTAAVALSGSTWMMTLTDTTQGWTSTTPIASPTPAPEQYSAEWIVEDPNGGLPQGQVLTDFAPVIFTGTTATVNGSTDPITSFPFMEAEITNGSTVVASPGTLDAAGTGFTDTYGS